jgi:hypothetical protein
MTEDKVITKNRGWISQTLALALAPLLAYLYSYIFEFAYASYFGIPLSLIRVDWTDIFSSVSLIVVFAVLFLALILFLFRRTSDPKRLRRLLLVCLPFFNALVMFLLLHYDLSDSLFVFVGSLVVGVGLVVYYVVVRVQEKRKGSPDKPKERAKSDEELGVIGLFLRHVASFRLVIILFFFVTVLLTYHYGIGEARDGGKYMTIAGTDLAVLRIYDDVAVCSPLDEKSMKLSDEFKLVNLYEDPELTLIQHVDGPLYPAWEFAGFWMHYLPSGKTKLQGFWMHYLPKEVEDFWQSTLCRRVVTPCDLFHGVVSLGPLTT